MAALTAQELALIANTQLDLYIKNEVFKQTIQDRPLLKKMLAMKKPFAGAKEYISSFVEGTYPLQWQGFTGDDTVTYGNPTDGMRAVAPWRELHGGFKFTGTELKAAGILVSGTTGESVKTNRGADAIQLNDLFDLKLKQFDESMARSLNLMLWRDGTQDAKEIPGITSFIVDNPSASQIVQGINQGTVTYWRNRASLTIALGSDPSALPLILFLKKEIRQLKRYGGKPNLYLAGSDFLDRLELEMRSKGTFTQAGWSKSGGIEVGADDPMLAGVQFTYDPTLDDLGWAKRCYVLDTSKIHFRPLEGDDMRPHYPERSPDKYVYYRAVTMTAALLTVQRNCHGVYAFA